MIAQAIGTTHRTSRVRFVIQLLMLACSAGQISLMCGCQTSPASSGRADGADELMNRGAASMREGSSVEAIDYWKEAESEYAAVGRTDARFDALIDLTARYQTLGKFEQAERTIDEATSLLPKLHSPAREVTALMTQADLYIFTHRNAAAADAINKGLALSSGLGFARAEAGFHNALGNLRVRQGQYADALTEYKRSASMAGQCGDHGLRAGRWRMPQRPRHWRLIRDRPFNSVMTRWRKYPRWRRGVRS